MAKKISELTAIPSVAAGDMFPVVDVSAGNVTKKATFTQLIAALLTSLSGSAGVFSSIMAAVDGTGDIGAVATGRFNSLYLSNRVTANTLVLSPASSAYLWFSGRSLIKSPADGELTLWNQGETGFNRLNFGDDNSIINGSGTPEAAITAPVGSIYSDLGSGDIYAKKTGAGNTGWEIIGSGGGGGGGGWVHVTDVAPSGTGGIMSFTSLSAYNEIMLFYRGIRGTPDFGFTSRVRVSINNGSTYLNSSGDYASLSTQGVETNEDNMKMHGTIGSGLKTGWRIISNFNTAYPKNSWTNLDGGNYVIPTTSPLDAIQIYTSTGLDWDTVGRIYIFGRA